MKQLFLFLLVFNALIISAQDAGFKQFAIGVTISPDYCYRTLKNDRAIPNSPYIKKNRDDYELPMFGYTTGLNIVYYFKESFGLEIGVCYSKKGYKTDQEEITTADYPEGGLGKVVFKYNYNYLEVPLKVNVKLGAKKAKFISQYGISTKLSSLRTKHQQI